jgi:hypothetical protein
MAVMQVVGIGGSKSLRAFVEEAFSISLPEPSSTLRTTFAIEACQVIGTVSDRNVTWNVPEPIVNISHCLNFIGNTEAPLFLIVPLKLLQNLGNGSDPCAFDLHKTLQNLNIDAQQLPLQVIIADEGEGEDVGGGDALGHLNALMKALSYSYRLLYWNASKKQFSFESSQINIADTMKETAIKFAESNSTVRQAPVLEECERVRRTRGVRIMFSDQLKEVANTSADDQSKLSEMLQLEKKGLVVRGPPAETPNRLPEETEKRTFTDPFPTFFILQPMWFYEKVTSFIQAVLDRRTREDLALLPSARNNAFYSKKFVDDVAKKTWLDISPEEQQALMDALHYHGVVIAGRERSRHNSPNYQEIVFIPATLSFESLPSIEAQAVSPIALRSPGKYRKKIPHKLYYYLVAALAKRFRCLCTQTEARFNVQDSHVQDSHVLQLLYSQEYACIKVTMFVFTEDPTFTSTSTAKVCADMRTLIAQHVTSHGRSYNIQFAAVVETDPEGKRPVDFVDLGDVDVMSASHLYSVGNYPFHPPNDFYLWFGEPGKVTKIRKHFDQLSKHLNAVVDVREAAAWLFKTWNLAQDEMIDILRMTPSERGSFLLLLLGKRGRMGDALLDKILYQSSFRKLQDPGNGASSQPSSSQTGRSTISPPRDKRNSSSQTLILDEDVQRDSSQSPRLPCNDSTRPPPVHNFESTTKEDGPPIDESIEDAADERGGVISRRRDPLTTHEENPDPTEEPPFHRDRLAVPCSTSFKGIEPSSIAVPHQQTNTPAEEEEIIRRTQIYSAKLQLAEEPQVHPIFEAKFEHVQSATDNFDSRPVSEGGKRLGSGSFGTVYFAVLHSEAAATFEVAIKRLKKASRLKPDQVELSRQQFMTEMHVLTRYIHPNIVKLIGFSSDGPDLCLLYEYMSQGTLSNRLDCKDKAPPIHWQHRITIGRDIATALEFLHTRYRQPVTHRDVKSANVLLGKQMEAKLNDFGLAFVGGPSKLSGPCFGTRPYMPPEAFDGVVSPKGDVYALGMVLYELATGLPPYSNKKKQDLVILYSVARGDRNFL